MEKEITLVCTHCLEPFNIEKSHLDIMYNDTGGADICGNCEDAYKRQQSSEFDDAEIY